VFRDALIAAFWRIFRYNARALENVWCDNRRFQWGFSNG
jgi:hypothetical protein